MEAFNASAQWLKDHYSIGQTLLDASKDSGAAILLYEKVEFVVAETPHI